MRLKPLSSGLRGLQVRDAGTQNTPNKNKLEHPAD